MCLQISRKSNNFVASKQLILLFIKLFTWLINFVMKLLKNFGAKVCQNALMHEIEAFFVYVLDSTALYRPIPFEEWLTSFSKSFQLLRDERKGKEVRKVKWSEVKEEKGELYSYHFQALRKMWF